VSPAQHRRSRVDSINPVSPIPSQQFARLHPLGQRLLQLEYRRRLHGVAHASAHRFNAPRSSSNVAGTGCAWGDRGLDRIFHVNQCTDVCPAIVETVATINHLIISTKQFSCLHQSCPRDTRLTPTMQDEEQAKTNNTGNDPIGWGYAFHPNPITWPLIFNLYLL
jgi:hypothetical protein